MLSWFVSFAQRQSREEIARQHGVITSMERRRRLLTLLPFVVATLYLPPWLCLVLMVVDTCTEMIGIRLLADLDPAREPRQYFLALASFVLSQVTFMVVPGLIWQDPDDFAKAFAVGLFLVNLVHLSTLRTVHLPLALIELVTATALGLFANSWFWLREGDLAGLAISTVCVLATAYFTLMAMTTVHQLHDEMLRDRQAAEGANDAKSRFLAQMSHELRTPLNAILGMGFAEMMQANSPETKERMGTLVQSARGLSVLLNDILDMSAVQAGQLPIRPSVVALREETKDTLDLFRQQVADAGLNLSVAFASDLPGHVRLDGLRFRQCLSNVVSNAIKYTQSGQIDVTVTRSAPDLIAVDICDTGPGVPEALREQIFEPFQRGDTLIMGTGLGLSISRTLARRMGGDLVLLPSPKGALFRLTFALDVPTDTIRVQEARTLADLTGRRVLVVDDIATNRLVASTYLRLMGAEAIEADRGEAAVGMVAAGTPDVVLLDMLMPEMDGIATLARIRALPGAAGRTAVIAMTADATEAHRLAYLAAGLDGYVSKPLSPETLGDAVLAALQAGPAESDIARRN